MASSKTKPKAARRASARYATEPTDFGAASLRTTGKIDEFVRQDGALVIMDLRSAEEGHAQHARVLTQFTTDKLFYANPSLLSDRQFDAANRYRILALRAQLLSGPRIVNYQGVSGGVPNSNNISEGLIVARRALSEIDAYIGLAATRCLMAVVVADETPRQFGLKSGLGKTDGIGIVRWCLDTAADFWKIPREASVGLAKLKN